jgi:hypothetical protein
MMRVSEIATKRAFNAFCARRSEWVEGLGLQLRMYRAATRAFEGEGSPQDFRVIYDGLKKWLVFRHGEVQPAETILSRLMAISNNLRTRPLSQLGQADWRAIWEALLQMKHVKRVKAGASVMAVSKFLHFWNPRLFVICDQTEVEQFVFGHRWLAAQLDSREAVLDAAGANADKEPRLSKYLRLLALASEFVKTNPHIVSEFARTVRAFGVEGEVPADIETYEATAVEWCILGLAEMPPQGMTIC